MIPYSHELPQPKPQKLLPEGYANTTREDTERLDARLGGSEWTQRGYDRNESLRRNVSAETIAKLGAKAADEVKPE